MKRIDRTLFWFYDQAGPILKLNEAFLGLSTLLNRLLNEKYEGRKIQFINLDFATLEKYETAPSVPMDEPYYYGGHLRYYGLFDSAKFSTLTTNEKKAFVWKQGCDNLMKSATSINNTELLEATQYAYKKGIAKDLNPDFCVVKNNIELNRQNFTVSVWINFTEDSMFSKLIVEKNGNVIFEQVLDKSRNGIEFFLEIYKKLELKVNLIIVKRHKDAGPPVKVPFSFFLHSVSGK